MDRLHAPVLLEEVRHGLAPVCSGVYVDGTLGMGGHARMLLEASRPDGTVIGIERDARNLFVAREQLATYGDRVRFVHGSFGDLRKIVRAQGVERVDGVLLDLGFSSAHVDDPTRGFSFQSEGPLDMRYDTRQSLMAADIVNGWREDALAELFFQLGEERRSRPIAKAIVAARRHEKFRTTTQLADVVARTVGRRGRLHPATRIFQALRIAVNDELGALHAVLPQLRDVLKPGGRAAIITFHSLEDRIVKRFFRDAHNGLVPLTKKPVTPSLDECRDNPRARSAKLRVAQNPPAS